MEEETPPPRPLTLRNEKCVSWANSHRVNSNDKCCRPAMSTRDGQCVVWRNCHSVGESPFGPPPSWHTHSATRAAFSPQSASCLWASPRNFSHPFASSIPRHGEGGKRRGREKRGRLIPSVRRRRKKYISTTYIAVCAHSSKTRNGNPRNNCSIPPDLFFPLAFLARNERSLASQVGSPTLPVVSKYPHERRNFSPFR